MLIQNVRDSLEDLTKEELNVFLIRLKDLLLHRYGKDVKYSALEDRVKAFINGTKPSSDYLEAYWLTFEELAPGGALNALQKKKVNFPQSWRELLIHVTNDRTLPPEIIEHLKDEQIRTGLKALFFNCIDHCKNSDKGQFYDNLSRFNNFFEINK
ncbi:hypothetical protein [Paenibacillus sp. FSL R5-0914]|uniref:hypothetical protein n=1 Tax=Paenibacillus sp. FSL R5-0914 TaxID=2921665 RepID=UPI0030F84996